MLYLNSFFLANLYLTNWSSTFSIIGQFFSLICIFIFILFLTFYTTKFLANFKIKSTTKGNINIIETTSIGTNYIHILKVSNQYFLVSSSKEGIRLISELKDFDFIETIQKDVTKDKFKEYFNIHLGKFKK